MFELIISAICSVFGTILLVIGIDGITASTNYKNTAVSAVPDSTEFLIGMLMIVFGIFLITF